MDEEQKLSDARKLYKPSPKVEELVLKLVELFDKPLPNGVVINGLRFDDSHLKIGGLSVKMVEREKSHSMILVHWYPNYEISTTLDPFCSAFVLRYNSLQKLYREVEKVLCSIKAR